MAVIVSPITGKTLSDLSVEGLMGMVYEDLAKIIENADITLRYPEFERSYGEWGGLITEGRIPAADGVAVDKNTTAICGPYYFTVDTRYYDQWVEAAYPSEVRRVELTKILRGESEYADFLRKVVTRNVEGFRKDVNASIDATFVDDSGDGDNVALLALTPNSASVSAAVTAGVTNSGFLNPSAVGATQRYEVLTGEGGGAPTWKQYWSAILKECMHMVLENAAYTEGSNVYGQSMEDLTIYVPIDVLAESDIHYLQHLFNRAGIDKLPTIKTHNGTIVALSGGANVYPTFILDKHVINHVTRYESYDEGGKIPCRFSEQITLHVEHMTKYSPLYKAFAFVNEMPIDGAAGGGGGDGELV